MSGAFKQQQQQKKIQAYQKSVGLFSASTGSYKMCSLYAWYKVLFSQLKMKFHNGQLDRNASLHSMDGNCALE